MTDTDIPALSDRRGRVPSAARRRRRGWPIARDRSDMAPAVARAGWQVSGRANIVKRRRRGSFVSWSFVRGAAGLLGVLAVAGCSTSPVDELDKTPVDRKIAECLRVKRFLSPPFYDVGLKASGAGVKRCILDEIGSKEAEKGKPIRDILTRIGFACMQNDLLTCELRHSERLYGRDVLGREEDWYREAVYRVILTYHADSCTSILIDESGFTTFDNGRTKARFHENTDSSVPSTDASSPLDRTQP